MNLLRQNTAASVLLGPFLDDVDGKTPETALDAAATDVDLYKGVTKSDIADTDSGGDNDFAHVANGYYSLELTAGNVDTPGPLRLTVNATGALPLWADYQVVPAAVYDALIAGTGNGVRADVQAIAANALTASALASDAVAEIQSGLASQASVDTIDDLLDTEVAAIAAAVAALPNAAAVAAAVGALAVDGARTAKQVLAGLSAVHLNKASNLNSTTAAFRDAADTKDRVTATKTADGDDRTAVTVDLD